MSEVQRHYEKYPYPSYPLYVGGRWKDLDSIDCSQWGVDHPVRDIWLAGCGTIAPLMFGRRNFRAKVIATDLSQTSLKIARLRLILFGVHHVLLRQEDLTESVYDSCFDAVDAYGVIHHVAEPEKALQIIAKSLRPGGVLRLMLYSKKAREEIEKMRQEMKEKGVEDLQSIREILHSRSIKLSGDLDNSAGLADALLHPLVHLYDEEKINKLLEAAPELKILKRLDRGNYVLMLKKVKITPG